MQPPVLENEEQLFEVAIKYDIDFNKVYIKAIEYDKEHLIHLVKHEKGYFANLITSPIKEINKISFARNKERVFTANSIYDFLILTKSGLENLLYDELYKMDAPNYVSPSGAKYWGKCQFDCLLNGTYG